MQKREVDTNSTDVIKKLNQEILRQKTGVIKKQTSNFGG
jgi:hypothetical protein